MRWVTKFLLKIASVNLQLLTQCPEADAEDALGYAKLMIGSFLYQSLLFTAIGHALFAAPGHLRADIVVVGVGVAWFILLIDSRMIMASSWHLNGISELKRGGIDVSGGAAARIKTNIFLAIRICLSVGLAQLTAVFVGLLVFAADISSLLEQSYLKVNRHQIEGAETLVDSAIKRAADAVTTQTAHVDALAAQVKSLRQDEIDPLTSDPRAQEIQKEITRLRDQQTKADEAVQSAESFAIDEGGGLGRAPNNSGQAGQGPRYRAAMDQVKNAKAHAADIADALAKARGRLDALQGSVTAETKQASHGQLTEFEQALKVANEKLTGLKAELDRLANGRESAIRRAVESAPDHISRQTGFLAQIVALERLAEEDRKIALVILLIDFVSFGLELAAVLAKVTSYCPTTYATLLARDAYLTSVRVADEVMTELKAIEARGALGLEVPAEDVPLAPDQTPPTPRPIPVGPDIPAAQTGEAVPAPKRKRGRPRKHPLPLVIKDPNEQGG
jgi:uncharacterized protein YukE